MQVSGKAEPQRRSGQAGHQHIQRPQPAAIQNIDHGTHRSLIGLALLPVLRFRNIFTQPQGENDGQNADEKQRTPAPHGDNQAVDLRGDNRPY